jgi:Fe-S-cluster containining protein
MRNVVPCGDCHLCCKLMTPVLPEMGDDASSYSTAMCFSPGKAPYLILNRHDNGDCVYLGPHGCLIWERAPWTCRRFDCREVFKNSDRAGRKLAVKHGDMSKEIFDRGRELLKCG